LRARAKRQALQDGSSSVPNCGLPPPDEDSHSRVVRMEDILPDSRSDDDDVPIVSTITFPKPKRKGRTKGPVKWIYETVSEPTGAVSKYWDAGAPAERATKRLAKDELVALKAGNDENDDKGSYEQVRADNMERNNALLISLGFEPMPIEPTLARSATGSVSNSDDDDY
jgi:hypothetical protein